MVTFDAGISGTRDSPQLSCCALRQVRDHGLRARNVKIKFAIMVFQGQMILTLVTGFSPLSMSSSSLTCLSSKKVLFLHSVAYLACLKEFLWVAIRSVVCEVMWIRGEIVGAGMVGGGHAQNVKYQVYLRQMIKLGRALETGGQGHPSCDTGISVSSVGRGH